MSNFHILKFKVRLEEFWVGQVGFYFANGTNDITIGPYQYLNQEVEQIYHFKLNLLARLFGHYMCK